MTSTSLLAALCAGALLSACATPPPPPPQGGLAPYREDIELSGRLSVTYQQGGRPAALSGQFAWRQTAARTDVSLASPLGQTIATIGVAPGAAQLIRSGQAPRTAADIDTLSAEVLGWPLPVSGLRDWLQGYAEAADGSRFAASPQRPAVTTRDGWRLRYVGWQEAAGPWLQPRRIDAERSAGPQVDEVAIRIVIDPPATPPSP